MQISRIPGAVLLASVLFSTLSPAPAQAQSWAFKNGKTSEIAYATMRTRDPATLTLTCVKRGFDEAAYHRQTSDGFHFETIAPPGIFQLFWQPSPTPRAAAILFKPGDAVILVDGRPFRDIKLTWDDVESSITAQIPPNSALAAAMKAGRQMTVRFNSTGERLDAPLRGSSRAMGTLGNFCGATQTAAGGGSSDQVAALKAEYNTEYVTWLDGSGTPSEGLAFVYYARPNGGNSTSLDILLYRQKGRGWSRVGRVQSLFGVQPRDARFRSDTIEVTTTTLRDGEPRCCPTGQTRWVIDRSNLRARKK